MSLPQAIQCGVDAPLLALGGVRIDELARVYLLEDVVRLLALDWRLLKALSFTPRMLARVDDMPLIVLYAELGVRAHHLLEFNVSRENLAAWLGESGRELLRVDMNFWPSMRRRAEE